MGYFAGHLGARVDYDGVFGTVSEVYRFAALYSLQEVSA